MGLPAVQAVDQDAAPRISDIVITGYLDPSTRAVRPSASCSVSTPERPI